MGQLKERWQALSLPMKILAVVALPLLLVFALIRASSSIGGALNGRKRRETDAEAAALGREAQAIAQETARAEGRLEAIGESRQEALKEAQDESASDFFNRRYDPDRK